MKKYKDIILNVLLSTLGLVITTYYLWRRFIRERLPRDIPLNLTIIGFIILCYICSIYFYIVVRLLKPKTTHLIIKKIVDIIYESLKTFDRSIKNNIRLNLYYEILLIHLIYFLQKIYSYIPVFLT